MKPSASGIFNNELGATAIEYGLAAALLAVAIIGGLGVIGQTNKEVFTCAEAVIGNANRGGPAYINDGGGACGKFESTW